MINKIKNKRLLSSELNMLRMLGKELYKEGYFITGGSIWCAYRGLPINDIDIFSIVPRTNVTLINLKDLLEKVATKAGLSFKDKKGKLSKFAVNFEVEIAGMPYKIQFITPIGKAQGQPEDVVCNFDIYNVALWIDEKGNIRKLHDSRYREAIRDEYIGYDIQSNNLVIGRVQSTLNLWERIKKYASRGMNINAINFQDITIIDRAIFLKELMTGNYTEPVEGYEAMTLDDIGFTPSEASRFLRDNAHDVNDLLSISAETEKTNTIYVSTPTSNGLEALMTATTANINYDDLSRVTSSVPLFRF